MIAAIYNDPVQKRSVLIIVIERDNLDRMREADPITLESCFHGGVLPIPKYPGDYNIIIGYEEDHPKLVDMASRNDLVGLLAYLERGRKFIPGVDGVENTTRIPRATDN